MERFKNSKFDYLRGCITFGLRNKENQIVSMYGRSIRDNDKAKHYYTANRTGLYPKYPSREARQLILTESVIDAATLLSISDIKNNYEILALYGTNGLTAEIKTAIKKLENLEEIILFFDGDHAGHEANLKNGTTLKELVPTVKISVVETLDNEDINSISQGHDSKIFTQLLKDRVSFVAEKKGEQQIEASFSAVEKTKEMPGEALRLNTINPNKIIYRTDNAMYSIKGGIRKDLDSLKVTLEVCHLENRSKSRNKLDLYEDKQTEKIAREVAEKLGLRADLIEQDLNILTDLLDQYREASTNQADEENKKVTILKEDKDKCFTFLKSTQLLKQL